jgi:hypothetical protein
MRNQGKTVVAVPKRMALRAVGVACAITNRLRYTRVSTMPIE